MKTYIAIVVATLACFQASLARSLEPYIAGGEEAVPHSHPHQVALKRLNGNFLCAGSIISDRWVITTAHCAKGQPFQINAVFGAHNLSATEDTTLVVPVRSIEKHTEYETFPSPRNDIALLLLDKSIKPYIKDGKFINIIRLPKMSDISKSYWRSKVTLSGWGTTKGDPAPLSPVLKLGHSTVRSKMYCKFSANSSEFDWEQQLCTGDPDIGLCLGDSGDPLTEVESDGERTLIGIGAYRQGGSGTRCLNGSLSIFVRVASFLNWIETVTKGEVQIRP